MVEAGSNSVEQDYNRVYSPPFDNHLQRLRYTIIPASMYPKFVALSYKDRVTKVLEEIWVKGVNFNS